MGDKLLAEWFWTDRWMGSSAFGLPMLARGLYREMLTQSWRRGAKLPNDHGQIMRFCGCTQAEWDEAWPQIKRYWRPDGDSLVNETQQAVYAEAQTRKSYAAELGRKRAESAERGPDGRFASTAGPSAGSTAGPSDGSSALQPPSPSPSPNQTQSPKPKVSRQGRAQKPASKNPDLPKAFEAVWAAHEAAFGIKPTNKGGHWASVLTDLLKAGANVPSIRCAADSLADRVKANPGFSSFTPAYFRDKFTSLLAERDTNRTGMSRGALDAMRRFLENGHA